MSSGGPVLASRHEAAGALMGTLYGATAPRHYGDPPAEYAAATGAAAVGDRSYRGRLLVAGKAPVQMLSGVLTNRVPPAPAPAAAGVLEGTGAYAAVLTPKGKMVSDLRLFWRGESEAEGLLLDVPAAGVQPLLEHLRKYLPPRFATVEDISRSTCMLTVLGPSAAAAVAGSTSAVPLDPAMLSELAEDEYRIVRSDDDEAGRLVARVGEVRVPAYDLVVQAAQAPAVWDQLVSGGCRPVGMGVWETLRIEAGRPAFGSDMDAGTIPTEAGIDRRAIDHGKGCYTGQEVIVRIRDRGHVNWRLRAFHLGDQPAPAAGTELFGEDGARPVGRVTSAASSPHFGETIALGYARREIEPPAEVRLGAPDGPVVRVVAVEGAVGE